MKCHNQPKNKFSSKATFWIKTFSWPFANKGMQMLLSSLYNKHLHHDIVISMHPTKKQTLSTLYFSFHGRSSFAFSSLCTVLSVFNLLPVCFWQKSQPWTTKIKAQMWSPFLMLAGCVKTLIPLQWNTLICLMFCSFVRPYAGLHVFGTSMSVKGNVSADESACVTVAAATTLLQ